MLELLKIFFPSFANERRCVFVCVCLQVCVLKREAKMSDVYYKLKLDTALLGLKNVSSC